MSQYVKNFCTKLFSRFSRCEVGLFHAFKKPPYGGSNQFFLALKKEFTRRKFVVGENIIGPNTKIAILNAFAFNEQTINVLHRPQCRIIHRIDGPVSVYRGSSDTSVDRYTSELNRKYADVTVLQSQYSLKAYEEMGIFFVSPVIIMNAVDANIFFPSSQKRCISPKVKLVATSWSDNPNKGMETYKWLDQNLDWNRFEFTFAGRINCDFQNIKKVSALSSHKLADLLRQHDIYITASMNDPCSNALIEGLACGLPALCANSGGHPEIVGQAGFCFNEKEEIPELIDRLVGEYDSRRDEISIPSIQEVVEQYISAAGNFHQK